MPIQRITRRDLVLVAVTAVACFAVAIPLTSASSGHSQRQFTVWPGNSARFANMDWSCDYQAGQQGSVRNPPVVVCGRESTNRGVMVFVDGLRITVQRVPGKTFAVVRRNP